MKALRNYFDKIKPDFEEGGKYHAFRSVYEGFESFVYRMESIVFSTLFKIRLYLVKIIS